MAREPYSPVPGVNPTAPAGQYINASPNPSDFGAPIGGAEEKLGSDVGQTANVLDQNALRMQDMNNTRDVRETLFNKFLPQVNDAYSKYAQLEGKAAADGYVPFQKQLNDMLQNTSQSLTSPMAQNDFMNAARFSVSRILGSASMYAAGQQKKSWVDGNNAAIAGATNHAVLMQNDPQSITQGELNITSAARDNAIHLGQTPEETQASVASEVGKYYRTIIETQAQRDPELAQKTYAAAKSRMDAPSIEMVERSLRSTFDNAAVADVADQALHPSGSGAGGGAAGTAPNGRVVNATWERMINTESHGQQFGPDGQPLTSSAGAIGFAQVEPATAREVAARHGIDYDEDALKNDKSYNHTIGRLYYGDLVKQYNGNLTLATAAYNAGPARVDQWVTENGDPRTGAISNAAWTAKIPINETRNYVQTNVAPGAVIPSVAQVPQGGIPGQAPSAAPGAEPLPGAPGASVNPGPGMPQHAPSAYANEQDIMNRAWTLAEQRFPDNPRLQRQAVQVVQQKITEANTLQAKYEADQVKAQKDAAEAVGQQVIKQVVTDPTHFDPNSIWMNNALTVDQKAHLAEMVKTHFESVTGGKETATYGPGFWQAYQAIHALNTRDVEGATGAAVVAGDTAALNAPTVAPYRITDPSQLWQRAGPGGDLTLAGVDKLTQEIAAKRTPDGEAEAQMKKGFFDAARAEITLPVFGETGKDPIGESKFAQFQVVALTAYENGRKQGLTPQELLSEKSPNYIGKLMEPFVRNQAEKLRDYNQAMTTDLGGAGAGKSAPAGAPDLTTKEGIAQAYRSGRLSRDEAAGLLVKNGFARAAPPPVSDVPPESNLVPTN